MATPDQSGGGERPSLLGDFHVEQPQQIGPVPNIVRRLSDTWRWGRNQGSPDSTTDEPNSRLSRRRVVINSAIAAVAATIGAVLGHESATTSAKNGEFDIDNILLTERLGFTKLPTDQTDLSPDIPWRPQEIKPQQASLDILSQLTLPHSPQSKDTTQITVLPQKAITNRTVQLEQGITVIQFDPSIPPSHDYSNHLTLTVPSGVTDLGIYAIKTGQFGALVDTQTNFPAVEIWPNQVLERDPRNPNVSTIAVTPLDGQLILVCGRII